MDAAFLLDAPAPPAAPSADQTVRSQHPIARLGSFKDPRYGSFAISKAQADSWIKNLAANQNGRVAIDYDHKAGKGDTRAAGWITSLDVKTGAALQAADPERWSGVTSSAEYVVADIEWTPEGAQQVRDRYWLYVSPEFTEHYRDEQQRDLGPALAGVALTNRPFLRSGMPVISLSREAEVHPFAEPEVGRDKRGHMADELKNIALALELAEDASAEDIAAAAKAAKDAKPEAKSLEQAAAEEGQILLSQENFTKLQADAAKGVKALEQLHTDRFERAYEDAAKELRVDAKPETKTEWRELFDAAPEVALKRLSAQNPVANAEAKGSNGAGPEVATEIDGDPVDEDSARLEARAVALAAEKGIDIDTPEGLDKAIRLAQEENA